MWWARSAHYDRVRDPKELVLLGLSRRALEADPGNHEALVAGFVGFLREHAKLGDGVEEERCKLTVVREVESHAPLGVPPMVRVTVALEAGLQDHYRANAVLARLRGDTELSSALGAALAAAGLLGVSGAFAYSPLAMLLTELKATGSLRGFARYAARSAWLGAVHFWNLGVDNMEGKARNVTDTDTDMLTDIRTDTCGQMYFAPGPAAALFGL